MWIHLTKVEATSKRTRWKQDKEAGNLIITVIMFNERHTHTHTINEWTNESERAKYTWTAFGRCPSRSMCLDFSLYILINSVVRLLYFSLFSGVNVKLLVRSSTLCSIVTRRWIEHSNSHNGNNNNHNFSFIIPLQSCRKMFLLKFDGCLWVAGNYSEQNVE